MTPWLVRLWRPLINRTLRKSQKITQVEVQGAEHVRAALKDGAGTLITPNHSFHYDSYVMIEAAHRCGSCFHFLSAWQIFAMSRPFEQKVLQWHGCYSINREGNDVQAFKTSVDILRESPHPLVIFPEGDIYHNNDRVTPFREGAAAVAMSAAKKGPRKVVAIPAALKCFYVQDPQEELLELMARLEESLHWRPRKDLSLSARIYKLAEGMLTLKEIEYNAGPRSGTVPERIAALSNKILTDLEREHALRDRGGIIPERVKEARKAIIKASEKEGLSESEQLRLELQMEDLFFVIQLFSYPGNYVQEKPTLERIAETLDKFEEDVLRATYPGIRGERHAVVRFGEPLEVPKERESKNAVSEWTDLLEQKVQGLLDQINAARDN
ncbi:MAG: 1-acyl-sn-glycerol-3-phosphate acyltransferase [Pirellulaceae bacterium]|nr:1-acyl-sn-glycerol-3-phosphate acyltransferase [Pirellulaceae bacterium]